MWRTRKVGLAVAGNIEQMNRLYAEQIEAARAERDAVSGSRQKLSNVRSTSKEKLSERSNQDYNNYPMENMGDNLDVIFENLNENFTRTDMIQSYQVWTQIANASGLNRRAADQR